MTELQAYLHICLKYQTIPQIADRLRVSNPTVERWVDGTNLPHPALHMADYVRDLAKELEPESFTT